MTELVALKHLLSHAVEHAQGRGQAWVWMEEFPLAVGMGQS